jgi:PST family polysaccharide transporter
MIGVILQIVSTVVLARFISPWAYGTVGMVATATAFAALFKDLGLASATIQREKLTPEQLNFIFWLNVAFASAVTLMLIALAPAVSTFYGRPDLTPITAVLAFNLLLSSCGAQHAALLSREMRFRALAVAQIAGTFAQFLTTLTAAIAGFQQWAIVLGFLAFTAGNVVLLWSFSDWRPGAPRLADGAREIVHFGANLTVFDFVNYFSRNLDNILIGRAWGAEQLGYYSRAYSLLLFPIQNIRGPLSAVALPALSRLQKDPEAFRNYYRRILAILALATMPIAGFSVVRSGLMIETLLGPQWKSASEVATWLAVVSFLQPCSGLFGAVLVAKGLVRRHLECGIVGAIVTSASFLVGIPYGTVALAKCYAVGQYAMFLPVFLYASRNTNIRLSDFLTAIWRPALATIVAAVGTLTMPTSWSGAWPVVELLTSLAGFAAIYLACYGLLPGGAHEFRYYGGLLREALPRKQTPLAG